MPDLPAMDVAGRIGALRTALPGAGCDAVLVTNLTNIRYLTGFTGSAALLLVTPDDLIFTTDGRYKFSSAEQLSAAGVDAQIEVSAGPAQHDTLSKATASIDRVGLEAGHVTWAGKKTLADKILGGCPPVATTGLVEALREVKDAGEQARIAAAAAIADRALATLAPMLKDGPSEAEFALALDHEMRRMGAERPSFETIVASGPNGAKPHARPSERRVLEGELVVIDFGAIVDGYCSDMTRTLCVGEPGSDELARIVEVVAASQRAGVDAVSAGASAREVDAVCRDVIAEAGWADAFLHSTGHGVGLDIHENPRLASTSTDTLAAGQVVTVEPGVYLDGIGGARIEDTVVVEAGGCRPLTLAPKDLVI